MQINCIAIDDEPLALSKLKGFIGKIASIGLIATFNNAIDAIAFLKENTVDLIFLDIEMEGLNGIHFLESVRNRPQVIIISAYEQYALKGFELNVTDYLLKPYSFERLVQAVNKALEWHVQKDKAAQSQQSPLDTCFFVKTEHKLEKINFEDVYFVKGMKDYLMIVTKDQKIMTLMNFQKMENLLPAKRFLRVHKSYIIALDKINKIERNRILILNETIPLTTTYKDQFYSMIKL